MREFARLQSLESIDDLITKENAEDIAYLLRERIGNRPFDLTIRNQLIRKPIISTGLRIESVEVSADSITLCSNDGSAGLIELDRSRHVITPSISVNHMRIRVTQYLPHRIEWSILLR
jgi:hypothetical protein